RNFVNCTIEFNKDFTLLCGKNGTGKTSLTELVYKLTEFSAGEQSIDHVASIYDVPRWDLKDFGRYYTNIQFMYRVSEGLFTYSLQIEHDMRLRDCRISQESLSLDGLLLYTYDLKKEEQVWLITDDNREFTYPSDWHYSGLPLAARRNSKTRKFCTNVSLCTNMYARFESEYAKALPKYINQIASANDDYKYFIANLTNVSIDENNHILFTEKSGDSTYKMLFSELSLGQKQLCMYYFLLNIAEVGSTLILDDLESHLSPAELNPLYNKILELATEKSIQFILISHNSRFLNWFEKYAIILQLDNTHPVVHVEKVSTDSGISLYDQIGENV
ncbi:MAG: ATP-binding protein, partial [Deferribacteraceae bacterium]|nr:ATP-binding protein [Deferribacteraceae bacterium]